MKQYIRSVKLTANGGAFVASSDGEGLCIRFQVQQAVRGTRRPLSLTCSTPAARPTPH